MVIRTMEQEEFCAPVLPPSRQEFLTATTRRSGTAGFISVTLEAGRAWARNLANRRDDTTPAPPWTVKWLRNDHGIDAASPVSALARRTRSTMLRWVSSTSSAPAAAMIAAIARRRG